MAGMHFFAYYMTCTPAKGLKIKVKNKTWWSGGTISNNNKNDAKEGAIYASRWFSPYVLKVPFETDAPWAFIKFEGWMLTLLRIRDNYAKRPILRTLNLINTVNQAYIKQSASRTISGNNLPTVDIYSPMVSYPVEHVSGPSTKYESKDRVITQS